jgi:IS5 family transposase
MRTSKVHAGADGHGRAREENVARGRKLRTDTPVVETNIHYPTDSTLLGDSVHVLTRSQRQKERWFQRGLRWRAGIEARNSTLKHPFSMVRATYKGEAGFQRYVGWCVISQNLVSMARTLVQPKAGEDGGG